MQCLPDGLKDRRYYLPTNEGREKVLAQRIAEIEKLKGDASL
jgi:putative ATPase